MLQQVLVAFLVGLAVICLGSAVLVFRGLRRQAIQHRLSGVAGDDLSEDSADAAKARYVTLLQQIARYVAPGGPSAQLQQELARAGFFNRGAPAVYLGAKTLLLIGGSLLLAVLLAPLKMSVVIKCLWVLVGGAALSFIPNLVVFLRRQARRREVDRHLADAVDMLEICVGAGMGMDMAWNSVAEEIRGVSPILADEMALTSLQMHLGASRAESMRRMADRTGAEDISSLVAVLVQTERFGTALSDALRAFADSAREMRSLRAAEAAEKMAVKMLFPLVLFIFPCILIVTAGPAGIKIASIFGGGQ